MDVIEILMGILESFNLPVYKQGSMSDDEQYPQTFITYWNVDTPDHAHYDNEEYGTIWDFNVFVYSNNPKTARTTLLNIRSALKQAGWICTSKGYDVQSDEPTHTGRAMEVFYFEV